VWAAVLLKRKIMNNFKLFFVVVIVFLTSSVLFAQEDNITEVRMSELNGMVKDHFIAEGITIGPYISNGYIVKCICVEEVGVYYNKQHIGNMQSGVVIERQPLIDGVYMLVESQKFTPNTNVTPDAQVLLNQWGGKLDLDQMVATFGPGSKTKIEFDYRTYQLEIKKLSDNVLQIKTIDYDGLVITSIAVDGRVKIL